MKKFLGLCFLLLLAFGSIWAQQEFNVELTKTYSKKKIIDKIIKILEKENKSINALDEDYKIFLDNQYKDQYKESKVIGPNALINQLIEQSKQLSNKINEENKDQFSPKFADSASIEMFSDGTSKGSFRLLKLRVGEPGLFNLKRINIPIYIYLAARGNGLSSEKNEEKNKLSYLDLLDPLGGVVNIFASDKFSFVESKLGMTHISLFLSTRCETAEWGCPAN